MNIQLKQVTDEVVHLAISGACRDGTQHPEHEPLGQVQLDGIYRRTVLVDMQEVTLLNSSGVGWLLVCHRRCREAGGRWLVHSLSPLATNVLRLMRIDSVLEIIPDERQALIAAGVAAA